MNVLEVTIDPDIKLDPDRIKGMPEDLQGHLLAAITNAAKVYNCNWTEIAWQVKFNQSKQPYIITKKNDNNA